MNRIIILVILLSGTSGTFRVCGQGSVINSYFGIVSANNCAVLTLNRAANGIIPGDYVLMIQMKGGEMSTAPDNYGDILSLGNTGNYEINRVLRVDGNRVWLQFLIEADFDYDQGFVQLVKFYIAPTAYLGDIGCKPWDEGDRTGGVIAIWVDSLYLTGEINASGMGFAGGNPSGNGSSGSPSGDLAFPQNSLRSGAKGYSIITHNANAANGRGKRITGGGGGNDVNAGGGGGSNMGTGGRGGEVESSQTIPSNSWGVPGMSLRSVIVPSAEKLLMGGGGGGGHQNDRSGSKGGNGGGIVIIKSKFINANNNFVRANGMNANQSTRDGAGGGGGGGTILIETEAFNSHFVEARGGNGGASRSGSSSSLAYGPGGGGGGGRVVIFADRNIPYRINISEGRAGLSTQNQTTHNNTSYFATHGESGRVDTVDNKMRIASKPINNPKAFIKAPRWVCKGDKIQITTALGSNFKIDWKGPDFSSSSPNPTIENAQKKNGGRYYLTYELPECGIWFDSIDIEVRDENIGLPDTLVVCNGFDLNFTPTTLGFNPIWSGPGGFRQNSFQLIIPEVNKQKTGIYSLKLSVNECLLEEKMMVKLFEVPFSLSDSIFACIGDSIQIDLQLPSQVPVSFINSNGDTIARQALVFNNFQASQAGKYQISVTLSNCIHRQFIYLLPYRYPMVNVTVNSTNVNDEFFRTLTFNDNYYKSLNWQYQQQTSSFNPFQYRTTGFALEQINLQIITPDNCEMDTTISLKFDELKCVHIPNSFSPNNDGLNDLFVVKHCGLIYFEAQIYNRWGEKIAESTDAENVWDGRMKGTTCPSGVYLYMIRGQYPSGKSFYESGSLHLLD